jgi:hypothetical protein
VWADLTIGLDETGVRELERIFTLPSAEPGASARPPVPETAGENVGAMMRAMMTGQIP